MYVVFDEWPEWTVTAELFSQLRVSLTFVCCSRFLRRRTHAESDQAACCQHGSPSARPSTCSCGYVFALPAAAVPQRCRPPVFPRGRLRACRPPHVAIRKPLSPPVLILLLAVSRRCVPLTRSSLLATAALQSAGLWGVPVSLVFDRCSIHSLASPIVSSLPAVRLVCLSELSSVFGHRSMSISPPRRCRFR